MFSICTVHSLGAGLDILVAATPITSLTTSVAAAAAIAALVVGLKGTHVRTLKSIYDVYFDRILNLDRRYIIKQELMSFFGEDLSSHHPI